MILSKTTHITSYHTQNHSLTNQRNIWDASAQRVVPWTGLRLQAIEIGSGGLGLPRGLGVEGGEAATWRERERENKNSDTNINVKQFYCPKPH